MKGAMGSFTRAPFVLAGLMLLPAFCGGQSSGLAPEVLLLSKAMKHNRESIKELSNYTCLETIGRLRKKARGKAFERVDTVRVEVGKAGNREMFSWPGGKFEEKSLGELVGVGLLGDGAFSLFADDLFVVRAATVTYGGLEQISGRGAVRFDYAVSPLLSRLTLRTASGAGDVTYAGSFWVDKQTFDLVRIDATAVDLPPQLGLTAVRVRVDYSAVQIDGRQSAIPQSGIIETVKSDGDTDRNEIDFTHCRKFEAETALITDADAPAPRAETRLAGSTLTLPAGLAIPLRLNAIETKSARIGDPVSAVVDADVTEKRRVLIRKGAVVRGRVRRIETRAAAIPYLLVGLEFSEIEAGEDRFRFTARLESIQDAGGIAMWHEDRKKHTKLNQPNGVGTGGTVETTIRESFDNPLPGVGYLYLESAPFEVPNGFRMAWRTQPLGN